MKIYLARMVKEFLPARSKLRYPPNNTNNDYSIEQDFLNYLHRSDFVTSDYQSADWVYLPVYWQRHCYHNSYYVGEVGLQSIQRYLSEVAGDPAKRYFTVCCIDNGPLGTPLRRGMMRECYIFNGCLGDQEIGNERIINVPLITSEWKPRHPERKYLASFVGRRNTHRTRDEMFAHLEGREGVFLHDGYLANYAEIIAQSYLSLCPRGNGLASFRFYESMQLGVAPVLIAENDVRPFGDRIDWDEISFHVRSATELDRVLQTDRGRLAAMGEKAREVYYRSLDYGKWCDYVIENLYRIAGKSVEIAGQIPSPTGIGKLMGNWFKKYR